MDLNAAAKPEGETDEVTLGIDVSKYQGSIDWEQVAQSGVEFAMIRVGYRTKVTGIIYEDPGARYNLQEAAKNGLLVGAYFFSSAVTEEEAREEAAWVADFISRYPITYPVAYNCEDFQSPDSRQYGLGAEERTTIACAFLDTISAAGYTPMFYASRNEMEGNAQWNMDTLGAGTGYGCPSIRSGLIRRRLLPPTAEPTRCGSIPARERWRASGEAWT